MAVDKGIDDKNKGSFLETLTKSICNRAIDKMTNHNYDLHSIKSIYYEVDRPVNYKEEGCLSTNTDSFPAGNVHLS